MNECKTCNSKFNDIKILNNNGINIEVCPYCFTLFSHSQIKNIFYKDSIDLMDSILSENIIKQLTSDLHTTNKFFIPIIAILMTIAIIFPFIAIFFLI